MSEGISDVAVDKLRRDNNFEIWFDLWWGQAKEFHGLCNEGVAEDIALAAWKAKARFDDLAKTDEPTTEELEKLEYEGKDPNFDPNFLQQPGKSGLQPKAPAIPRRELSPAEHVARQYIPNDDYRSEAVKRIEALDAALAPLDDRHTLPSRKATAIPLDRQAKLGSFVFNCQVQAKAWEALWEDHFRTQSPGPWPASLVMAMMVDFKNHRGVRPFQFDRDHFDDLAAYNDMGYVLRRKEGSHVSAEKGNLTDVGRPPVPEGTSEGGKED